MMEIKETVETLVDQRDHAIVHQPVRVDSFAHDLDSVTMALRTKQVPCHSGAGLHGSKRAAPA